MVDYLFKTKPFDHQKDRFLLYRDKEFHAHLWEQGTGKSKMIVDTASWLYAQGKICAVLVVAPNGVQRNWVINEFPNHCPDYIDYKATWYVSSPNKRETERMKAVMCHKGLIVVAMNIEALATEKGKKFAAGFVKMLKCLLVVDESSMIKNPKAIRTKVLLDISVHAKYRRILTGTPVTQGPLDIFTQFTFLDDNILGTSSYYAFRNRYAAMREMRLNQNGQQRSFQVVDHYINMDDLQRRIDPHSDRVTKAECLDLPEKLFQKRYVELSKEQRKLYDSLKKDFLVEFKGKEMSAPLALTKIVRLQQIIGGFFQEDQTIEYDDELNPIISQAAKPIPIDKTNPRVESLVELLEETQGKVIIWSRFRAEIAAIVKRIQEEFGKSSVVEYHGGVPNDIRSSNIQAFQTNPECRYFVGHVQAGGKGLTLHAATTVVYFSNNFSLEDRLQSEDRAHRIGQTKNVTYVDFVAPNTLDEQVVDVLRSKKNVADLITGDEPLENWL